MIRKWEMAFWALLSGTAMGAVHCAMYGAPVDDPEYDCSCTMHCGEGERSWEHTYTAPHGYLEPVTYEASRECNEVADAECTEPPIYDCECSCEQR